MGKYDSSKTRVTPVFDHLLNIDLTGFKWLPRLLMLPSGGNPVKIATDCSYVIKEYGWGDKEKKLAPPVSLLSWLIRHPRKPLSGNLSNDPAKADKRRQWIEGSEDCITEGLNLLRNNPMGQNWHIFEGDTQPDVFIETEDLIIVIEGKRTERTPTTKTKWMDGRHQMIRHIDCAWEIRGHKAVIGFFIVEGQTESGAVPAEWTAFTKETMSESAIKSSLPHRGPAEQCAIASAFAGVTTWQVVCMEFKDMGLDWHNLPDTC